MLFTLFQALTLLVISAMALSPRDAIHTNDIDRYDSFIKDLELMDDHFLDMYLNNGTVTIDVYQHPSNDLTRTELFAPSSNAQQYFDQEKAATDEIFGSDSQGNKSLAELAHAALAQDRIPTRDPSILSAWRSVARTAFNSVAQLPTAAEIMGVHSATRFDKAVFGRNGVAEHTLVSSRWANPTEL